MTFFSKGKGKPQTFANLCADFVSSPKFRRLSVNTQLLWERELDFACRPGCLGFVSVNAIRPSLIQGYLDAWSDKPGKQAAALATFRALEKWAVVRDLLPKAITLGVETGRPEGGHLPWTDAQVGTAERHARPDISRAIVLGANTGQRISDLVRMGPTDLETYKGRQGINVTQKKTGRARIVDEKRRQGIPGLVSVGRRLGDGWRVSIGICSSTLFPLTRGNHVLAILSRSVLHTPPLKAKATPKSGP